MDNGVSNRSKCKCICRQIQWRGCYGNCKTCRLFPGERFHHILIVVSQVILTTTSYFLFHYHSLPPLIAVRADREDTPPVNGDTYLPPARLTVMYIRY